MTRARARVAVVGAVLATALAAAPALSTTAPGAILRPVSVRATVPTASGQLAAQGSGIVSLRGRLLTYGRVLGPGLIVIRDPGGDAIVRVNGRLRRIPRNGVLRVQLVSLTPEGSPFYIHDTSGLRVRIMGVVLDVAAAGHGKAELDGDGNFSVNGSATSHTWAEAAAFVDLEPASPRQAN
jgi:hypothetical protein